MIAITEEHAGELAQKILQFMDDDSAFDSLTFGEILVVLGTAIYLVGYGRAIGPEEEEVEPNGQREG